MSRFNLHPPGVAQPAAPVPEGCRRAARMLHSLPEADRRDLLRELDPAVRQTLVDLLDELAALGMPPDASWPDLLERSAMVPGDAGLFRLKAECVFEALVGEPDALIARVLALAAWPWKAEVMARFDAGRRSALEHRLAVRQQCVAAPAGRRAIEHQLVVELLRRCEGDAAGGGRRFPEGASRWRRRIVALLSGGQSRRLGAA